MMITLDTRDARTAKAFELADQAAGWLKCRTADGQKAYGIRSSRDANHVYFVTASTCTCEDTRRHPNLTCKHRLAVQLHIARVKAAAEQPASDTVDGLQQMVSDRRPVLGMVRHEDGEISWTSHEHANGDIVHLPQHVTNAAKYDEIFGSL
jgi:hypothetical protein